LATTIKPASQSVELAPSTQISRGFHDARMTCLRRYPFDDAQGKGRKLCRFVGRQPAAVADATFRRIGRRDQKRRAARDVRRSSAAESRNWAILNAKPIDTGICRMRRKLNCVDAAGETKSARLFLGRAAAVHLPFSLSRFGS
jgi:hypothetical protein